MKRETEAVKLKNGAAVFFILLPFAVVFASLFAGRYDLTLTEVTGALAHFVRDVSAGIVPGLSAEDPEASGISAECYSVVTQLRLPRLIAAVFVGAALSASGTAYQGIFRNPLVSPGLLGVSAGAGIRCGAGDSSVRRRHRVLCAGLCLRDRRRTAELLDRGDI